jgi:hypothetical protein
VRESKMDDKRKNYQEFISLPKVKELLNEEREILSEISKQEEILEAIKTIGEGWLKAYNTYGKDEIICKVIEDIYQDSKLKAKQLGIDISKYPKNLEELIK